MIVLNIMRCEGSTILFAQICDGFVIGLCVQYPGAEPRLLPELIGESAGNLAGQWELVEAEAIPLLLRGSVAAAHAFLGNGNLWRVH